MKRVLAVLLVVACAVAGHARERSDRRARALALFERAHALLDLPPTQPLRLRAQLSVPSLSKAATGEYELLRVSQDLTRLHIAVGDYSEVRVETKTDLYVQRDYQYQPVPIYFMLRALAPRIIPELTARTKVNAIRKSKLNGIAAECVELGPWNQISEYCFDEQDGALLLVREFRGMIEEQYAYSDFADYRGRLFPRTVRGKDGDRILFEVHVTEIADDASENIEIPFGARRFERCDDASAPVLVLRYPLIANAIRDGEVGIYGIVSKDGRLDDTAVAESVDKDLDAAVIRGLEHWRYKPGTCAGTPIESEQVLLVRYYVGRRFE
jgi:hypothetical protein